MAELTDLEYEEVSAALTAAGAYGPVNSNGGTNVVRAALAAGRLGFDMYRVYRRPPPGCRALVAVACRGDWDPIRGDYARAHGVAIDERGALSPAGAEWFYLRCKLRPIPETLAKVPVHLVKQLWAIRPRNPLLRWRWLCSALIGRFLP